MEYATGTGMPLTEKRTSALNTLALCLVAVFFGYWIFSASGNFYLSRVYLQPKEGMAIGKFVYPASALFILMESLIVIWVHRQGNALIVAGSTVSARKSVLINLLLGAAAGFGAFILAIPLLWSPSATLVFQTLVPMKGQLGLLTALNIFLFVLAVPFAMETVFRGIAQRILESYVMPLTAILVSASLSASLWHVFSFPFALILGLTSGVTYQWRRSLLACAIANSVMTLSAGAYLMWRN